MIEQSIADVLALRSVGGQALENRMKQMQTEIIAHLAEEESQILPTVAAALSQVCWACAAAQRGKPWHAWQGGP